MEVAAKEKASSSRAATVRSSSFECDSSTMDSLLGVGNNSGLILRIDMPEARDRQETRDRQESREGRESRLEQPCYTESQRGSAAKGDVLEELKRERLLRLLDREQAWYDAHQQAALAAEQLLSLCEHHQQQWLHPNQQSLPASSTIRS